MTADETEAPSDTAGDTRANDALPAARDDRVGYRRPPKDSQFKPGVSGNPRGRPRGSKSVADIVRKIISQKVTITENGRSRRVPRLEAILLRAAGEASRGEPRALRLLLQLSERYGGEAMPVGAERETMAADLEILRRYLPGIDAPPPPEMPPETTEDDSIEP